jgi:hypothetical protein
VGLVVNIDNGGTATDGCERACESRQRRPSFSQTFAAATATEFRSDTGRRARHTNIFNEVKTNIYMEFCSSSPSWHGRCAEGAKATRLALIDADLAETPVRTMSRRKKRRFNDWEEFQFR